MHERDRMKNRQTDKPQNDNIDTYRRNRFSAMSPKIVGLCMYICMYTDGDATPIINRF